MQEQSKPVSNLAQYHIVFASKYRRKVFYEEKRSEVREIIRALCQCKVVEVIEGEICQDHLLIRYLQR